MLFLIMGWLFGAGLFFEVFRRNDLGIGLSGGGRFGVCAFLWILGYRDRIVVVVSGVFFGLGF